MPKQLANTNVTSKVIKALQRAGFEKRQGGSHTIMVHGDNPDRYTTIPRHRRINPNLLAKIIKQCGLTVEQFLKLYR